MKYVNVRIGDEAHAWLKEQAKRERTTIQELVRRAIEAARSKKKTWIRS